MKIKPEYSLQFDMDSIDIVRTEPDGTVTVMAPISETAAMAWEGFVRNVPKKQLVDAIVNEFDGATAPQVEKDLEALAAQLIALGYAEA